MSTWFYSIAHGSHIVSNSIHGLLIRGINEVFIRTIEAESRYDASEKVSLILEAMNKEKEIESKVALLGFKKTFPDPHSEPDYFHWRLNIAHPFLNGLHVIVEVPQRYGGRHYILVYAKYLDFFTKGGLPTYRSEENIYACQWSENNLNNILDWLK